jgi:uncharacterized Zn-binding protein involved in type VI secretion
MSQPIAKQGDRIVGIDTHIVLIPSSGPPVPTPIPFAFDGPLEDSLSTTMFIDNKAVAVVGSGATNTPAHIPFGGSFQKPPSNHATISSGSSQVFVDNKAVARANDPARCCNDPADQDTGHVIAGGTTFCG